MLSDFPDPTETFEAYRRDFVCAQKLPDGHPGDRGVHPELEQLVRQAAARVAHGLPAEQAQLPLCELYVAVREHLHRLRIERSERDDGA